MKSRLFIHLICTGLLAALAAPAAAQQVDGGLPAQQLQPTPGGYTPFQQVSSGKVGQNWRPSFGVFLNYANRPLVLELQNAEELERAGLVMGDGQVSLIEHNLTADLMASITAWDDFEIGAALPLIVYQVSGESNDLPSRDISSFTVGDLRLVPKWAFLQREVGLSAALLAPVTVPTGSPEDFQGNETATVEPRVAMSFVHPEGYEFGAHLGYLVRGQQQMNNIEVGNELSYGFGYRHPIKPDTWYLGAELFGRAGLDADTTVARETIPLEALFSVTWTPEKTHSVIGGAGPGVTAGYGTPVARGMLGYRYTGFESPDQDFDDDGILNPDDACPNDPEDFDDFEDEDGCPDPDNDQDGLPDRDDACPDDPEDFDDFEDEDGCPDSDNDQDGIPDVDDECPDNPEDIDGFEDEDGCPDPDNDRDGIPDVDDDCPLDKEVYNGHEDEDGCPDEGDMNVQVTAERIEIKEKIFFEYDKAIIQAKSYNILNQVAGVIKSNPQIRKIEVQGHTDDRGSQEYNRDLSQQRAEAVVAYLIEKGVASDILSAKGYGESQPLIDKKTEAAREKNRRVEFLLKQQGSGAGGIKPANVDDN